MARGVGGHRAGPRCDDRPPRARVDRDLRRQPDGPQPVGDAVLASAAGRGRHPPTVHARRPWIKCPARSRPATCSVRRWPCPSPTSTAPTTSCCSGPTRTPRTAACAPRRTFPAASRPSGRGAARLVVVDPRRAAPPRRPTSGCRSVRAPTLAAGRDRHDAGHRGRAALASTSAHLAGLDEFVAALAPFTPEAVAAAVGVEADDDPPHGPRARRRAHRCGVRPHRHAPRPSSARPPRGWSTPSTSSPATSTGRAGRCSRRRWPAGRRPAGRQAPAAASRWAHGQPRQRAPGGHGGVPGGGAGGGDRHRTGRRARSGR